MVQLKHATALVTGGGTGIGRATAVALVEAGVRAITISYSTSETEARTTANTLEELGAKVLVVRADVKSDQDICNMILAGAESFGRLDILVNNAGTTRYVDIQDLAGLTDEVWKNIFDTNLFGMFKCCREASVLMKNTGGVIVNIASIAGMRATGSSIAYSVSKAGVIQLTRMLAVALAPKIRVNSVSPGMVRTNWIERRGGKNTTDVEAKKISMATPLSRVTEAEDVAEVIMGLVRSSAVTGENIVIDGGRSIKY